MASTINLGTFSAGEQPLESIVHVFWADAEETTALNLTGYSARFDFRPRSTAAAEASTNVATISDAANGEVTYAWAEDDLLTTGNYVAELWAYKAATGRKVSRRFRWRVRAAVAAVPPDV